MYYTTDITVVNYFGTQIPEIEIMDGQMKIQSVDLQGKYLTESDDHFRVTDVPLSETK